MKKAVVVAPHADDELISCGGTILNLVEEGWEVSWILCTKILGNKNQFNIKKDTRNKQIEDIYKKLGLQSLHELNYPAGEVCSSHLPALVNDISNLFKSSEPNLIFLPFPGDAHTDHKYVFQAGKAACKWFRYPHVEKVLCYETLSETNFDYNPDTLAFRPNIYIDIENQIEKKIALSKVYFNEFGAHPFPRSEDAITALAKYRGSSAGFKYAEAFQLILSRGNF